MVKQFLDRNLAVKLYTDFLNSSKRIKDLLDKNDEENAKILSHTVKEVSELFCNHQQDQEKQQIIWS
jgi:hypothetical protein